MLGEYVYVAVPAARVQEVYELLAGRPPVAGETAVELVAPILGDLPDDSTVSMAYRQSDPPMRYVLRLLAKRAGEWVPMSDLMGRKTYEKRREMGGMLGAFNRRWKNRYYGGADGVRAFHGRWRGTENEYLMDSRVAPAVLRAAEQYGE